VTYSRKEFFGILVPDPDALLVRVLAWRDIRNCWLRLEYTLETSFDDFDRVLVPRE
jgi:hypothetical protein